MIAPSPLAPGTIFAGEYRILRPLSEGGMGAVYIVEQPSTGKRRALKVMHPALVNSPDLRARFELEAKVSANIHSDHIVEVIAAGVDGPTGMPWLTMELLDGDVLSHVLAAGPMPPAQVYGIYFQLCHALGAAHAAGVIHRDLKPENVFLAKSRRADVPYTVKVLDFGIAKVTAEAETVNTGAAGTPLYMAPEQTAAGSPISPATDVWALGLLAFRMLTGRSYWRGGNVEDATPIMILRETLMEPLVPASDRASSFGLGHLIPRGFDAWFERCVARDAAARFPNATAAFDALALALGVDRASLSGATPPPQRGVGAYDATLPHGAAASLTGPSGVTATEDVAESGQDEAAAKQSNNKGRNAVIALAIGAGAVALFGRHAPSTATPAIAAVTATECPRDMAFLPSGAFTPAEMDSPVTVKAFCLDLQEVTAGAYGKCAAQGQCNTADLDCSPAATFGKGGRADHPMNCVTWEQAAAHCSARGARLPTEYEWEWAARGGAAAAGYPWGNDEPGAQLCWSGVIAREETCAVGMFPAGDTHERVRDLAGNVVEWTSSRFDATSDARVYRGGSFADKDQAVVRAGARHRASPTKRGELLGFRCAMDPKVKRSDEGAPF